MAKVSKETLEALQAETPKNINDVMARYLALMQEIKDRVDAIRTAALNKLPVHPRIGVELSYLQLRMSCELIALASVMAHGDLGVVLDSKIKQEDRPGVLLKMLEKVHPECYPRPFKQTHNLQGELTSGEDLITGFLTRDELPRLYGLCGNELHKGKLERIGRFPKTEDSYKDILSWHSKIMHLLGMHKIKVYNSADEIWVGMEEVTTKKPFWNFMKQLTPEQVDDLKKKGIISCVGPEHKIVRHSRLKPSKRPRRATRPAAKKGRRRTKKRS
jgi:hypothetical protein